MKITITRPVVVTGGEIAIRGAKLDLPEKDAKFIISISKAVKDHVDLDKKAK